MLAFLGWSQKHEHHPGGGSLRSATPRVASGLAVVDGVDDHDMAQPQILGGGRSDGLICGASR
jgi:hypothetical protein